MLPYFVRRFPSSFSAFDSDWSVPRMAIFPLKQPTFARPWTARRRRRSPWHCAATAETVEMRHTSDVAMTVWWSVYWVILDFFYFEIGRCVEGKHLDVWEKSGWWRTDLKCNWNTLEKVPHKKSLDWKTVQGFKLQMGTTDGPHVRVDPCRDMLTLWPDANKKFLPLECHYNCASCSVQACMYTCMHTLHYRRIQNALLLADMFYFWLYHAIP